MGSQFEITVREGGYSSCLFPPRENGSHVNPHLIKTWSYDATTWVRPNPRIFDKRVSNEPRPAFKYYV